MSNAPDYFIESENSTHHWSHFNITNHNVLDLGCGRWHTTDFDELSPIFFAKKANLVVVDLLKDKYNLITNEQINVFDEAARLYVLEDMDKLNELFEIWNDVVFSLYETGKMDCFIGWYAMNDEYLLGAIYDVIGITRPKDIDTNILLVNHNPAVE